MVDMLKKLLGIGKKGHEDRRVEQEAAQSEVAAVLPKKEKGNPGKSPAKKKALARRKKARKAARVARRIERRHRK